MPSRWFHPPLLNLALALGLTSLVAHAAVTPIPQRFKQEVALHRSITNGLPTGPIQLVDSGPADTVRALINGHWYARRNGSWSADPSFDPPSDAEFAFAGSDGKPRTVKTPWAGVRQFIRRGSKIWIITANAPIEVAFDQPPRWLGWPAKWTIHNAAVNSLGRLWIASNAGLHEQDERNWIPVPIVDSVGRSWATTNVLTVAFDLANRAWVGTRAGLASRDPNGTWKFYEGKDGLPWSDFTASAAAADGTMWFATHLGLIRWDGSDFHYRQGKRWLPNDDVRQLLVEPEGAVWAATAGGLGRIEFQRMTLASKAAFYEEQVEKYIKRTPFGYVAEAPLKAPADLASAHPQDSDNDGLWTAMYGAGECFAYAATQDAAALERARKAFEALRFLQVVTQGGNPSPDKGYVARTIRPVEWPDPNVGRIEGDRREQQRDALWKAYEPRWPRSADGKWFWKGDTSSDELDGHYFFYSLYYDHCAKSDAEKARVREVVQSLTDHLVSHGFALIDVDGKVTRWAVYGPQEMNRNPFWWVERGLNSLSILSYLAVTAHITGDNKYHAIARELVEKHGYAQNLMFPKAHQGPGSGNQSDDEMAFMCFYTLMRYGKDPTTQNLARYSFFQYWANDQPELNPFFHFAHAAHNLDQTITNVWGKFSVTPWPGWFEDSRAVLYGFPLDRLNWDHKNSHRLDVVPLALAQSKDLYEARSEGRGRRTNGKVLPVENRHFNHWNTDPWDLDYGGSGTELGSGTVFLLPYYMGLYHGFVEKP